MLDQRFTKLEKTVEKIHQEFKLKLFEGVTDNLDEHDKVERSLTLNFAGENGAQREKVANTQWKDVITFIFLAMEKSK